MKVRSITFFLVAIISKILEHFQSGHLFQGRFKCILVEKVLQCDLERIKNCTRISESDKLNRDILLYWLWQEGKYTNLQIGDLFGLTHSSVSRRVTIIRKKIALEKNFQNQVEAIKSQIKPESIMF